MAAPAQEDGRAALKRVVEALWERPEPVDMPDKRVEEEQALLEQFVIRYQKCYDFSTEQGVQGALGKRIDPTARLATTDNPFVQLFQALLEHRFLEGRWDQIASGNLRLVVLQCLRLLVRDKNFQRRFLLRGGRDELISIFDAEGEKHYDESSGQSLVGRQDSLLQIASMLSKLEADVLVHCCKTTCYLLSTSDPYLLQCVLVILNTICASPELLADKCRGLLHLPGGNGAVEAGEKLLAILEHQRKPEFRQLAAEMLLNAVQAGENRQALLASGGVKVVLRLVNNADDALLSNMLLLLEALVEDQEASRQVRNLGGVNLMMSLLSARAGNDGAPDVPPPSRRGGDPQEPQSAHRHAVLMAGCSLITELAFDDDNSCLIRQLNGVFVLGKLLLHSCDECGDPEAGPLDRVQAYALRALRLLFSLERNRKSFKRIFPPATFERFIEVGQYQRDLQVFEDLTEEITGLPQEKKEQMRKAISEMHDLHGDRKVGDYILLGEAIGKGAFGVIHCARRQQAGQTLFAIKEIPVEKEGSAEHQQTHREVELLRQMDHPNVVKYVESFTLRSTAPSSLGSQSSLYIVMELVEGSNIMELVTSHAEKGTLIPESKIREWLGHICHALYYIHKKKNITHRDLTPNNILLATEQDALSGASVLRPILVDFGLARQRASDTSVMASVVGTLTYSCPELIEKRPYTDKADIWSLGVIMYQLVTLKNPFMDNNALQTARRIVEGDFAPIEDPDGNYSSGLKDLIARMMTPSTDKRPDVIAVLKATACWDRTDRETQRGEMERTDELYLRTKLLEDRVRRLQQDKERLLASAQRDTITRGNPLFLQSAGGAAASPHVRNTSACFTPGATTPGGYRTPSRGLQRHFVNTPGKGPSSNPRRGQPSLRVSASHVKEVDPASQMLHQLHKIVYVTQLPPDASEHRDHAKMRRTIEKYKQALFSRRGGGAGGGKGLKQELQKLLSYSTELIDVDFAGPDVRGGHDPSASPDAKSATRWEITYEKMCYMLEELLKEADYYKETEFFEDLPAGL